MGFSAGARGDLAAGRHLVIAGDIVVVALGEGFWDSVIEARGPRSYKHPDRPPMAPQTTKNCVAPHVHTARRPRARTWLRFH